MTPRTRIKGYQFFSLYSLHRDALSGGSRIASMRTSQRKVHQRDMRCPRTTNTNQKSVRSCPPCAPHRSLSRLQRAHARTAGMKRPSRSRRVLPQPKRASADKSSRQPPHFTHHVLSDRRCCVEPKGSTVAFFDVMYDWPRQVSGMVRSGSARRGLKHQHHSSPTVTPSSL